MRLDHNATREELFIECARLEGLLRVSANHRKALSMNVDQLMDQLGQAQAGLELADLIKRMVSSGT